MAKKLSNVAWLSANGGRRTKRRRIMTRDKWVCQICLLPIPHGAVMGDLLYGNVDHIIPQSKGGANDDKNFQAAHAVCNSIKSNQDDAPFKMTMRVTLQQIVESVHGGHSGNVYSSTRKSKAEREEDQAACG